ncbi:unnamed protein product, partial [Effrenium voratum]
MCVTQIGTRHFIRRRQNKDKGFMPRLSDVRFFRASLRMTCQELSTPSKSRAACLMVDTVMHSMLLNHELRICAWCRAFFGVNCPCSCSLACLLACLPTCLLACLLVVWCWCLLFVSFFLLGC